MKKDNMNNILMQNILQSIDEGIHVIDSNGKTIMYNDVMEKLEGLEKEVVLNKKFSDVFPSLDEETSTLFTVMKTGRPILDRTQTYFNYKGQKITTINTTIPLFDNGRKLGAVEIAKDITKIKKLSEKLLDLQEELTKQNKENTKKTIPKYTFDNIIGNSEGIKKAINIARKSCNTSSSVLIYGETGVGKELFAQSIHYEGVRKNKPFIAQNCAALPESLLEGLLFGTVKGSFTGAIDRPGLFEQANGGTLLLDEINSMGMNLQAKLLRVLQEGYIRRVGGLKDIPIDVRIIATTNEDPKKAIEQVSLRKDLYYRLNVVSLTVPPLRDRTGDIELLCDSFIRKYNKKLKKDVWMVSQDIMNDFDNYMWPGNVRELESMIEGAMNYINQDENVLKKYHFPLYIDEVREKDIKLGNDIDMTKSLPDIISKIEEKLIINAMMYSDRNISRAAKSLGIKRQTLQHKLKKYNI
ncbi:sigma-54 interaction domain-containing protein [Sporosalibacterium faouarense]|uniref:sigma-54 interaction domain-containing protein n=1 Tax=Sporosalibacterium faouarense TaxID=516123 RepID=UPI00141CDB80|nr:sigma 54-interacting transcriptional regulator [Sporosalibacterium faouarense]MTI49026.1 PAS domain S-box protein [Bacillota bacterium]